MPGLVKGDLSTMSNTLPRLAAAGLAALLASPASAGLINGSFETSPPVTTYIQTDQSNIPGWLTTASDQKIEIWQSGFNGVPAYLGTQFAELNATQPSTLYQDVTGIAAGAVVGFEFAHRGRNGNDTMRFGITDLGTDGTPGGGDDTVLFTNTYTDGTSGWGFYSGTGIVALGNTVRFSYEAVDAAGGASVGNFLDAAAFGVGVGTAVPEPATLGMLGLSLLGLAAARRRRG
jgi:hypothetical protein